jgi:hypothetical protein
MVVMELFIKALEFVNVITRLIVLTFVTNLVWLRENKSQ